jgi:hypothetical protein
MISPISMPRTSIDSENGIAWRLADPLSMRDFLG